MRTYEVIVKNNGEVIGHDDIMAGSPLHAAKLIAWLNADTFTYSFYGDEIEVKSSRRTHNYKKVEYYADDNSFYLDGVQVA